MKKKGMKSLNLVGYVEEICRPYYQTVKLTKSREQWYGGKWVKDVKDYRRAPVRGGECLNYDVGQSYAGKCLLIALQKESMYGMECALCVCVPICASKIHNTT